LDSIGDERDLAAALTPVARALVETGDWDGAQRLVEHIVKLIEQIYYEGDQALALSRLALALSECGAVEMAASPARMALLLAEDLKGGFTKASVLEAVASASALQGNAEVLERTWAAVRGIEDQREKATALVRLASALSEVSDPTQPVLVFREALTIARLAGRESVFEVIKLGAGILEADRRGASLWEVYEVLVEVEDWWEDPLSLFIIS
jgi:hypothetical protein